jgi:hypothetical protein
MLYCSKFPKKGIPMAVTMSVSIRPGGEERELEHKAKMRVVAKLITGSDTPSSWLIDLLSNWSFEVASAHSIETLLPTRSELHDALEDIEDLATRLLDRLQSSMIQGFLATGAGKENEHYIRDGLPFLSVLMRDSYKAKNSPRLLSPDGKVQRGAGRPHLPGRMAPKYVGAALIAEAWAFFHDGEDPKPSDQKAQEAAERFYSAWFPSKGWGTNKLKGWATYLDSVRLPDLQDYRKEFGRHLAIEAEFEARLIAENNVQ